MQPDLMTAAVHRVLEWRGRWLVVRPIAGLPDRSSYLSVVCDCLTRSAAELICTTLNDQPWGAPMQPCAQRPHA